MKFDPPSPIPTNIDFLLIQPLEKKWIRAWTFPFGGVQSIKHYICLNNIY